MTSQAPSQRTLILTVLVELTANDDPGLVADALTHAAMDDAGDRQIKVVSRGTFDASLTDTFIEKVQDEPDNIGFTGEPGERLPE
ncbi:hypothetical protein Pa4123_51790 [Phytohabitans aurantiacus]|uniref:Uncharacterized protein n=1 Tax=Phytohabitans aurantiacus TaxID=3016789 RepID=A0ABQ5QZB3_9ACTN|nr:hypothetical protein Pa4123_51790 [Phytohabitans aurantiacus]